MDEIYKGWRGGEGGAWVGRQIADMKRMAANMRDTCVAKKETMKHD